MEKISKTGGSKNSATVSTPSRSRKPVTSFAPRMLSESEIDSLRRQKREIHSQVDVLIELRRARPAANRTLV